MYRIVLNISPWAISLTSAQNRGVGLQYVVGLYTNYHISASYTKNFELERGWAYNTSGAYITYYTVVVLGKHACKCLAQLIGQSVFPIINPCWYKSSTTVSQHTLTRSQRHEVWWRCIIADNGWHIHDRLCRVVFPVPAELWQHDDHDWCIEEYFKHWSGSSTTAILKLNNCR